MTKTKEKTRKSAAYHHGDLKRVLVDAGRKVLEEKGVEGLSLRGVARAAGVSQAAPYHHFSDKDALLAAIAAEGFAGLASMMTLLTQDAQSAGEHMGGLGAGYIVFAFENPELFRLMHGPRFAAADKYEELLVVAAVSYEMLEAGVAGCLTSATETELDTACKAAWSLVHGASMLLVDGRIDAGTTRDEIVAFANSMTAQLPVGGAG